MMSKICNICSKIHLRLVADENKKHNISIIKNNHFEKVKELPAVFCTVNDRIIKKN